MKNENQKTKNENQNVKGMKVAILYDFLSEFGGLERVMVSEANSIDDSSGDVTLDFSFVNRKIQAEFSKAFGLNPDVSVLALTRPFFGSESLTVIKSALFPNLDYLADRDLVISHSVISSRIAYKNFIKNKVPYCVFMHHPPNFLYTPFSELWDWANAPKRKIAFFGSLIARPILKWLDKKYVLSASKVFVNSEYTARRIKSIYGVEPIVIYPPIKNSFKKIDDHKKIEKVLDKFGIGQKGSRFIYSYGRVIPDKRYDYAIQVISELSKSGRSADAELFLVIAGSISEEYRSELLGLAEELGVLDRVKILGRVGNEESLALYNAANVFLFTAPLEDFGMVPVESILCGTPVVAWSDNAGPSEIIVDGMNGYLAKAYDVGDFVNKVRLALDKKWNYAVMAKSVRRFLESDSSKVFLSEIKEFDAK